jgi:hypothetical protein
VPNRNNLCNGFRSLAERLALIKGDIAERPGSFLLPERRFQPSSAASD